MNKPLLCFMVIMIGLVSCKQKQAPTVTDKFIKVENGQFIRHGQPYYYVGTNFWYGAILGSTGEGGNRERLNKELDYLKSIGIENLRVLVGSDGENGVPTKVEPTLQVAPGVYNDTIFQGLDYLLAELNKRDMTAVLFLNNAWEWSGGYSQYLAWTKNEKAPIPAIDGWPAYMSYVQQFVQNDSCKALFAKHVKYVLSRTNSITGIPYTEDPAIFSWQVANEPRAFSDANKKAFAAWIGDVAKLIKSLDKNHMVSTGSEGLHGCEYDLALVENIHTFPEIDYINFHIWPYNWSWTRENDMAERMDSVKIKTLNYIEIHQKIAQKLNKPMVIEEFGFPRDGFVFTPGSSTVNRDSYYAFLFSLIKEGMAQKSLLAGCNFWAWGGFAEPSTEHIYWQKGDDYCGDPAQEQQGLNSVFAQDSSTIKMIKNITGNIK